MKHSFCIFFLIFLSLGAHAQLQTAHWYFGDKVGLDFSSGNPVVDTNGKIETLEGCTSISDEFGNLMFYSDGQKVYNRNHSIMANGNGLLGHSSSTSSAVVLPKPDNCNLYYLFTIDARERREKGINYNIIDMSANGGLGVVIQKNIPVPINGIQQGYEKLAAISNADKSGYWIVTHFEGHFYAFPVTAAGVGMNPVVSPSAIFGGSQLVGYLKASPDGSKLGMAMSSSVIPGYLSVYDFDPATGIVSNEIILYEPSAMPGNYYGIEFSPNGKLLYATNIIIEHQTKVYVEQYNLTAPNIAGSKYLVSLSGRYGALQLALDGKIYNAGYGDTAIAAIINPDTAYNPSTGAYPTYKRNHINLNSTARWGLPTFLNNYFRIAPLSINGVPLNENQQFCVESILDFNYCYQGGQIESIHWDFGDGSTSGDLYPTHTYTNPGNYTITLTVTAYGNTYIRTYLIEITEKLVPTFDISLEYCQNATVEDLPKISENGIKGTWNPATIDTSETGTKTYTFSPNDECAKQVVIKVKVEEKSIPIFSLSTEYCKGQTPQNLPLTSQNGIKGTWFPATIDTSEIGTKTYTFTPNDDCSESFEIEIKINEKMIPTFSLSTEYCQNQTPQNLPLTSQNGIKGTWFPATIDTSEIGTKTYTFTPNDDCSESFEIEIKINEKMIPTFSLSTEYCQNQTPQNLPLTSQNGIKGTWFPATIDTSEIGTKTYTFTPNDECAEQVVSEVKVEEKIIPNFDFNKEYCKGQTPQNLPLTSQNGISGTWFPATIDTSEIGTKTYTFTPNEECAEQVVSEVKVEEKSIPIFSLSTEYCKGQTPQNLPLTSQNGIKGTWFPATIDTSKIGTTTYTFTPNAGECADAYHVQITIADKIKPTFDNLIRTYCKDDVPKELPLTSDNGITGTWFPALMDTSAVGTINYIFTPNNSCADSFSFVVTVIPKRTPTFTLRNAYCMDEIPQVLPNISDNGIVGTWNPSAIDTSIAGAANYIFTPNPGQCTDVYTLAVTVSNKTAPTFNVTKIYCKGSTPQLLPKISDNGITGTWNPSAIDTSTTGVKTYVFMPDAGQCATTYTEAVTVKTIVLSTPIPDHVVLCEGENIVVDAGNDYPDLYYNWTWGSQSFTGSKITITEAGNYTLTVSNGSGCKGTFHLTATYYDKPVIKSASVDDNKITIVAEGENLEYSLDNSNWQTSNVFDNLRQGGLYTVYVRSNGCLPISIKISIYKVTNFISPNGDGYNDTWSLYPEGVLEASHIIIADRYGSKVYEKTSNTGFIWDGKQGGKPLPTGTYWYILEIPATHYLPVVKYTGFILLKNR